MLAPLQARQQRPVPARQPAHAQPRQAVGLGGHVQGNRRRGEIRHLGQAPGRVEFQAAVHLVAEEADAARIAEVHEGLERGGIGHRARRVVREVHRDEPGVGPQGALQAVQVQDPAVLRLERQPGHLGARGDRERLHGLVAGHREEDVVAGAGRLLEQPEERLLGAGEGQDVLGLQVT